MTASADGRGPRWGLVADVHSNLQALEAALEWIDARGVDAIWCLGDVVGYGGDPAACIARVRERCAGTVRGNHDLAVVDPRLREWFNPHARAAIERQAELLGDEERTWLAELPSTIELDDASLAHSGFADPDAFDYVVTARQAAIEIDALPGRLGFYGHTHVPDAWRRGESRRVEQIPLREGPEGISLEEGRWIVNPGAVGQPRDRDPRAACAVFDTGSAVLEWARIPYDVEAAQEAIRHAGMPDFEARRLAVGM